MKPTRKANRRSFLGIVAGGAAGGALAVLTRPARALQITDTDTGPGADPAGRGRGRGRSVATPEPGDSDFIRPIPQGDTFRSDEPPGLRSGYRDSDGGPAADRMGYGTSRNRAQAQAARCLGTRRRIARYEAMRPRTPDIDERLAALRRYLGGLRCG